MRRTLHPTLRRTTALVVVAFAIGLTACGGGDSGSLVDGGSPTLPDDGSGLPSSTMGGGDSEGEFTELPGRVRFANFISDGTAGVDIDVYWGTTPDSGRLIGTVPYGTVTDFMAPQHAESSFLDADEAGWSFVPVGGTTFDDMIGGGDESFTADASLTVAVAAAESFGTETGLSLSSTIFYEHDFSTPPAGSAHVYAWDSPWATVTSVPQFGVVGSAASCDYPQGEATGGNAGTPSVVPAGTTGLTLFDANTQCATGAAPSTDAVADGGSYVLIGVAPSSDPAARTSLLLPVGLP